uniref:Uncharacterized protein n=1 Tax=Arundo donax TaxID=35708 RepID=A0A0A9BU49_ARUDO
MTHTEEQLSSDDSATV